MSRAGSDDRGMLVAVEGIDGAGKTGLIRRLIAHLEREGRAAQRVRRYMLPEITDLWWRLVAGDDVDQHGTAMLAAADYAAGVERVIRPALAAGRIVLADKYVWSHLVFFRLRGVPEFVLQRMFADVLLPDVILHLDVPVDVTYRRLAAHPGKPDLLECGLDFRLGMSIGAAFAAHGLGGAPATLREQHFRPHQAAAAALYREVLPAGRVRTIDAAAPPEAVFDECLEALREPVR